MSKVTLTEVVLAVAHFSSQAKGEDGISQGVIAKAFRVIGYHLVDIFNASLSKGIFPESWNKAHLVPLKKTTISSTDTDFRPVALLSFLSKVLKMLVPDQILAFLFSKIILDPFQSGFRPGHSTQTTLLKLMEDIRAGIDN